jgi:hypothetical protein
MMKGMNAKEGRESFESLCRLRRTSAKLLRLASAIRPKAAEGRGRCFYRCSWGTTLAWQSPTHSSRVSDIMMFLFNQILLCDLCTQFEYEARRLSDIMMAPQHI